jgi:hypothetical protein
MGVESDRYDWRERNLSTVVLAFVRVLRDPALAWDVATEGMAAATLAWATFPGGSRMAWVLEHGRLVLRDARHSGRVSSHERTRNRVAVAKRLGLDEQRALSKLAQDSLDLDPEAAAVLDAIAREAPPPGVLLDIALSPLTSRAPGTLERERG